MKAHLRLPLFQGLFVIAVSGLLAAASFSQKAEKEMGKTMQAKGTFEVKLTPQDGKSGDSTRGRMLINKQLHGDLEGASEGQMLTAMTSVKGSAGYVAIEKVSGTLHGRKGSFVLQHSGTMTRGEQSLSITVVPDSGTDQLTGLTGKMAIKIVDGKHFYEFEYSLAKITQTKGEIVMAETNGSQASQQTPKPNPDLKSLERLVGAWKVSGGAQGEVRYEWAEGGFFLVQHFDLVKDGRKIKGVEFIGHLQPLGAEPGKEIRTRVYSFLDGLTLDYVYELEGDTLTIWGGEKGSPAYYKGKFSADGNTLTGGWVWPGGGYKTVTTRVK